MNQLQPYATPTGLDRDLRRSAKVISHHQLDGQVAAALVDVATDLTIAKVDSLAATTSYGMAAVARIAQTQAQLELLSPDASGRLAMLAEQHALAVVEVLHDHHTATRRW